MKLKCTFAVILITLANLFSICRAEVYTFSAPGCYRLPHGGDTIVDIWTDKFSTRLTENSIRLPRNSRETVYVNGGGKVFDYPTSDPSCTPEIVQMHWDQHLLDRQKSLDQEGKGKTIGRINFLEALTTRLLVRTQDRCSRPPITPNNY